MDTCEKKSDRTITNLALRILFVGSVLFGTNAPLIAAERTGVPVESRPVESEGVTFVIAASRVAFESNEPLTLQITYRNTTAHVIWLPDYWPTLHLQDAKTGMSFTGQCVCWSGVIAPFAPPIPLYPDKPHTLTMKFDRYGFIQGDIGWGAASDELFRMAKELRPDAPGLARFPLPSGVYHLKLELQIQSDYRRALPRDFDSWKEPKVNGVLDGFGIRDLPKDFDLPSVWKVDALRSNDIEIKIADPAN